MCSQLQTDTGIEVCKRTVERYLRCLRLKIRQNDLSDGKVTREEVVELIKHAHEALLANSAGYQRMRQILLTNYGLHLPRYAKYSMKDVHSKVPTAHKFFHFRKLVYNILKEVDHEGIEMRLKKACKRRVFRTVGPNHIWSADGNEKLKAYGITVYGFIDAWSRKILGIFVHVTNNDPRHVGVYFLNLAKAIGGILEKITTDGGTETGHMATFQIKLSHEFCENLTIEQAQKRMHYTKSTRNQE
jgi:hypothetical protein